MSALAARYGENAHVTGWQIDNEFGCHDTILSYGPEDLNGFRQWLAARYGSIAALNRAWGNVFWSAELRSFDEVALPNGAVTETAPSARLDFQRFSSEQVVAYAAMQADILRAHSPGRFVTHNFMGRFFDFDHFAMGRLLDFASWDSYPLGFTEQFPFAPDERADFIETAHPDMAPFHHDLYRAVGGGRFWIMEQQPGPVNWAPFNPVPKPGMVRLWTWEAFAHGAELVSYFRWRQCPFAQEQMHAGLQRPDRSRSAGGEEALRVAAERERVGTLPATSRASVALVFDYEAAWITRIQPQGANFNQFELCYRWYEAARRLGQDVDIVPPGASLAGYRAVLVPRPAASVRRGVAGVRGERCRDADRAAHRLEVADLRDHRRACGPAGRPRHPGRLAAAGPRASRQRRPGRGCDPLARMGRDQGHAAGPLRRRQPGRR